MTVVSAGLVAGACRGGSDAPAGPDDAAETTATVEVSTTTSTTEAPLEGEPLVVVEQGVSSFPDPFDPTATLGGYGVVLENPNTDVLAAGVRVKTTILDDDGTELLVDNSLLNAVMPSTRMALGRTLIEPIEDPTNLRVEVTVTTWLRPENPGAMTASEVVTEPEANGGAVTKFVVTSTLAQTEDGVDVTALYRAEDGRILGAESTVLASVVPDADTAGQIRLLSPIPDLAVTEVFVGRGIGAQTTG